MNRHSVRLLAAAFAVAGLAGCFDDPTSSLRNGPDALDLSRTAMAVTNGDSVQVEAVVRDAQGNPLPATSATWTTDNAAVAVVNLAAIQPPGGSTTRAYVKATNAVGAVTYVRLTARGVSDSIRVTSLPGVIPAGAVTVLGAARADTVPGVATFTAGDTVEVRLPVSTLTFDAGGSVVRIGTATAYTLFRSDTLLRVLPRGPVAGPVMVTNVIYAGALGTGPIVMDSLPTTDIVNASRARFRGTISVAGDTVTVTATGGTFFRIAGTTADTFTTTVWIGSSRGRTIERTATMMRVIAPDANPSPLTAGITVRKYVWDAGNTIDSAVSSTNLTVNRAYFTGGATVSGGILLTVTPPPGMTFQVASTGADTVLNANVRLGTAQATRISRTTTQMQVSVPGSALTDYAGPFVITNMNYGTYRIDSLTTAASYTLNRPFFAGSVAATGSDQLDTLTVNAPAGIAFVTAGTVSQVLSGGVRSIALSRTATQMVVVPSAPGSVSLANIDVGGTVFPSMNLATAVTVGSTTGEANEPANDAPGAVAVTLGTAGSPLYVIGAVDGDGGGLGTDADDFFAFTLAAPTTVTLQLQFGGTGSGGATAATNPDIDLLVCNAACSSFPFGFAGASAGNPENHVLTNAPAGTYNIYINGWDTAAQTRSYRLVAYQ